MRAQAKRGAGVKPVIGVGDKVRVRVKPQDGRGAYRVTETAWTEQIYEVEAIEYTAAGPMFSLRGWSGSKLTAREVRKVLREGVVAGGQRGGFQADSREGRAARNARLRGPPVGPAAPP